MSRPTPTPHLPGPQEHAGVPMGVLVLHVDFTYTLHLYEMENGTPMATSIGLLPSGSEQHEVLLFGSI